MSESVLVTGSSRGIGKAIALELSKNGYQVVVHYLSRQEEAEAVLKTIASYGGEARVLQFDVSDREQSKRYAMQAYLETLLFLQCQVNNGTKLFTPISIVFIMCLTPLPCPWYVGVNQEGLLHLHLFLQ